MNIVSRHNTWRAALIAVVVLFVLAACAPAAGPAPASEPSAAEGDTTPRSGGVLNYALVDEPTLLDPNLSSLRSDQIVFFSIYDCLVALDPETQEFVPWLATSWERSDDGLTYTFTLREDVTFHDGTPFNAEAVKFNFDRVHNPDLVSRATAPFGSYGSAEVVDEYTVRINLVEPIAAFLDYVSFSYRMISPAAVQQYGDADFGRNPVGTGPFKFVEWVAADHILLEKNPDYNWGPATALHQGPAYLDQINFRMIPESGTRMGMLENGDIQVAVNVPSIEAERLKEDSEFQLIVGYVPGLPFHFALNSTKPPTDELAVRQAMNYGVDREAIVRTIFGAYQELGANTAAYNVMAPNTYGYDPTAAIYNYDPEKAKQLLEEAGWVDSDGDGIREKNGEPLHVILGTWETQSVADVAQAQLREIGFDIEVRVQPSLTTNEQQQQGVTHGAPLPAARSDPDVLRTFLHSDNIGGFNFYFISDPELDEWLETATLTVDRQERAELYSKISHKIMELALFFPLYNRDNAVAATANVRDLRFDRGFFPLTHDVWLAE
jgi:peptide/nickel transport system substrate-binding protein